ncbi:hypothetical protein [Acinetobacter sp.]|nr:hypothetical protein [Acinetobacter sp.]MDR2248030.1 hypothetical protein [Acinetobacter sp.]
MVSLGLAAVVSISVEACDGENDDTKQQDKTTIPHSLDKDS